MKHDIHKYINRISRTFGIDPLMAIPYDVNATIHGLASEIDLRLPFDTEPGVYTMCALRHIMCGMTRDFRVTESMQDRACELYDEFIICRNSHQEWCEKHPRSNGCDDDRSYNRMVNIMSDLKDILVSACSRADGVPESMQESAQSKCDETTCEDTDRAGSFWNTIKHHTFRDGCDKWARRFLNMADLVATWSKDPSTKVGAVITDVNNRVVSTGYNGLAIGVSDSDNRLNDRDTKYKIILHAEENAIMFAKKDLRDHILYVTSLPPCPHCASLIIQSGIKTVVTRKREIPERWQENIRLSTEILNEAGVELYAV